MAAILFCNVHCCLQFLFSLYQNIKRANLPSLALTVIQNADAINFSYHKSLHILHYILIFFLLIVFVFDF